MRKARLSLLAVVLAAVPGCRPKEAAPDSRQPLADLRSPDRELSGRARLQLITLGEAAVPDLAEMLRSGAPEERLAAANTLWGMGERGRAAEPDLTAALTDGDPRLRVSAAMALESMGPAAAPAVPALAKALGDREAGVRQAAARALGFG